jgi:signal transduction histidine kinase
MAVATFEPTASGDGHLETIRLTWDRFRAWDDDHRMLSDVAIVLVVLGACFLAFPPRFWFHRPSDIVFQLALIAPLAWRRKSPSIVFCSIAAVAFAQWLVTMPLPADVALLIALFTLAVHETPQRALLGTGVLEVGAILAAVRWAPAGDVAKSLLFLTGLVVAALFTGITMRTLRAYTDSLVERATRLELERDQQAQLASAAERSRIAREMHDVVAHNVSIMVTLADGARTVAGSDPARAQEAMGEVSEAGRLALADMRHLLGVLHTGKESVGRAPQPQMADLPQLIQGVRATGLKISVREHGDPFDVPAGAGLTVYRIVQESLTNIVKHATNVSMIKIVLLFDAPLVTVSIRDDGQAVTQCSEGHGLNGMRERAAMYGGELRAGPGEGGGWEVSARVRAEG